MASVENINKLQTMLDKLHDAALFIDANLQIIAFNKNAWNLYAYPDHNLMPKSLLDLDVKKSKHEIPQNLFEQIAHKKYDGSEFMVTVYYIPTQIYAQKGYLCILDSKQDAMQTSSSQYKQIIDFSLDAIFIHRDNKIIFMNKSALKLFGINYADQIIGTSIWQLYPPERHGIVRARNQTMEQTGQSVPIIEHTMLRFDGSRIQVEAMACPIDYEGIPSVYVALRDISERKKNRLLIELQHKVSKFLIESANVLDISNQFLESVCLDLGLTKGMVWALDKEANMLRLITYWTAGDSNEALANVDQFVPINFGIAGKVIGTGEADWVLQDEEIDKVTIAIPIVNEQEILGVIELINDTNKTRDEVILDTLIAFGEQIGLFIKRKKFEKDLAYLTKHDPITGLSNRAFFEETLQYELHLAQANDTRLAIIFIDIDSFGIINQTIGHTQGDVLLQKIGGMLSKTITSKENLARFGPQFAVLISDIEGFDDINGLINEINENVATVVSVADQKINIILNFGIALYPDDGTQVQELLQAASIAVGSAREKSGGTIQFFSSELNKRTKSRLRIETDLREALEKQELFLLYQPIVDSASMKVAGFEALLRWEHAGKLISPAEFIPIAEKNHLINPIGAYAMRTACQQCKEWIDQFKVPISISVNISPIQLKTSNVLSMLQDILAQTQLAPDFLRAEITESVLMDTASINTLSAIKDLGVKISIDDFGIGFSSLNYLRHLPIDYIKIDQSFVRDMTTNTHDAAIVKTIIDLAHNLNYKVIAEGVETIEQFNFLTTMGCNNIQGYYFSMPLNVLEATQFLQQGKILL